MLKVKRLHKDAVIPKRMTNGAAGYDLTAVSMRETHSYIEYGTGLAFQLPKDHVGLLFQRSSVSNMDMSLTNAVGVLDSDFSGEVTYRFKKTGDRIYKIGDRIGQILFIKLSDLTLNEVSELQETERGINGYGSTGK